MLIKFWVSSKRFILKFVFTFDKRLFPFNFLLRPFCFPVLHLLDFFLRLNNLSRSLASNYNLIYQKYFSSQRAENREKNVYFVGKTLCLGNLKFNFLIIGSFNQHSLAQIFQLSNGAFVFPL